MKKGFIYIMAANCIGLVLGVLTNFVLPRFLSIETYAMIKTYTLYISYAGFFSFGYNDGMYLKFGGKNMDSISSKTLGEDFVNYVILQFLFFLLIFGIGTLFSNKIVQVFSFGMVTANVIGYLKSFYQATGEFRLYSKTLNIEKIILFAVNIALIFIIRTDDFKLYIWCQVILGLVFMFFLIVQLNKKMNFLLQGRFSIYVLLDNIRLGFFLMLGNFASGIFTGLDRWFIKILMDTSFFALYSYAVSMENLVHVFMTPITVSMYPYFCKENEPKKIIDLKNIILIWGFVIVAAAFPAKWIVENHLQMYVKSIYIIFPLFASQVFYVIIKGVYVNIYKAEKKQKMYFSQVIFMTIIAIILNAILFYVFKTMQAIAVATLFTAAIWLILCELGSPQLRFGWKEITVMVIMLITYFTCGYTMGPIKGCIFYCITGVLVGMVFMKRSMDTIFESLFRMIKKGFRGKYDY